MFANAARNFVEEVDHGGLLIPVSGLNDSIAPLTVVLKRKRFWFWQKHKYHPTDFNLNDLLTGDAPIKPGMRPIPVYNTDSTVTESCLMCSFTDGCVFFFSFLVQQKCPTLKMWS
uniref:Gasdermin pore forming domain-containing protein n=1 Tax=Acanthochromis polyacanthus TaxID=80966 RepID=A0A3Q1F9W3_9TELE